MQLVFIFLRRHTWSNTKYTQTQLIHTTSIVYGKDAQRRRGPTSSRNGHSHSNIDGAIIASRQASGNSSRDGHCISINDGAVVVDQLHEQVNHLKKLPNDTVERPSSL